MSDIIRLSPAVKAASVDSKPIVALESTIITHGMPWPRNAEVARGVEAIIREEGCEPATIAVLDGTLRIGLAAEEIDALARTPDVMKLSSADLGYAVSQRRTGSTTVAATMTAMHAATRQTGIAISVFATGGIGGVHRGWTATLDISADLDALAEHTMVVVCAGPKAILDVPATLEALETRGVPVIGYGTDELPAFWSRSSGLPAPLRVDEPRAVADMFRVRRELAQSGSLLVTVPVPREAEIVREEIASRIEAALASATHVKAKDVTPYLLSRMLTETGGRSLETNIALIRNNARVAARIAKAL